MKETTIFPEAFSHYAFQVDAIYWALIAITVFFTVLITGIFVYLAFRYRRTGPTQVGVAIHENKHMELAWSILPLFILMGLFFWGAKVYLETKNYPKDAIEIIAVGKQWMWKFQHPSGRREINNLHIPSNKPVVIKMISQDVLHSLYFPALRIKQDVLPMYYTKMWMQSEKEGESRLYCAEYCGKDHSVMGGKLYVLSEAGYAEWLKKESSDLGGGTDFLAGGTPEAEGEKVFTKLGCVTCHAAGDTQLGPKLTGLYGTKIKIQGGREINFDDNYIRESILNPSAKLVEGFQPVMPTYQGQVSEDEIISIISYIKSLGKKL